MAKNWGGGKLEKGRIKNAFSSKNYIQSSSNKNTIVIVTAFIMHWIGFKLVKSFASKLYMDFYVLKSNNLKCAPIYWDHLNEIIYTVGN